MKKRKFTTREMALLIGTLVYTFPGVQFGPLFYRNLEFDKDSAFKSALGNLEGNVTLSPERITDLIWWVKNLPSSFRNIDHGSPNSTLTTDASHTGWEVTTGHNETQ